MRIVDITGTDLLNVVKQMGPKEFDVFIERALSLRRQPKTGTLSAEETKLIKRINRGLPAKLCKRHVQLTARRNKGSLSSQEHQQLLELTHQAESRDADRAEALVQLAKLRRVPLRVLMKQLGIQTPPIHG